jgi:D-hexose-6-phosphate mutarotase
MQSELGKCEKELKSQQDDMKHIRAQLAIMKQNVLSSLRSSEEEGMSGIQRLRNILKKNETGEQERKMRVRREMTWLYEQHDNNNKMGDEVLNRLKGMQRDIFNC